MNEMQKALIAEVRRLADEYPDAIYDNDLCFYTCGKVTNGPKEEGCIFGQVLRKVCPNIDLSKFEDCDNSDYCDNIEEVLRKINLNSYPLDKWCETVQYQQDQKKTWSEAVRLADKVYLEDFGEVDTISS